MYLLIRKLALSGLLIACTFRRLKQAHRLPLCGGRRTNNNNAFFLSPSLKCESSTCSGRISNPWPQAQFFSAWSSIELGRQVKNLE